MRRKVHRVNPRARTRGSDTEAVAQPHTTRKRGSFGFSGKLKKCSKERENGVRGARIADSPRAQAGAGPTSLSTQAVDTRAPRDPGGAHKDTPLVTSWGAEGVFFWLFFIPCIKNTPLFSSVHVGRTFQPRRADVGGRGRAVFVRAGSWARRRGRV